MGISTAIGLLGGTFDPVHNGHLAIARHAREMLALDQVFLLPCHRPPHRDDPTLSSSQRVTLLEKAVQPYKELSLDVRELQRDRASYTVETLEQIRAEKGEHVSISFIMGADAFAQLDTWYQWQRMRDLAHVVVMRRPNCAEPTHPLLLQWVDQSDDSDIIHRQSAGGFVTLAQPEIAISATDIRAALRSHSTCCDREPFDNEPKGMLEGTSSKHDALHYLPDTVRAYIEDQCLYRD